MAVHRASLEQFIIIDLRITSPYATQGLLSGLYRISYECSVQVSSNLHNPALVIPPRRPRKGVVVLNAGLSLALVGHLHKRPFRVRPSANDIVDLWADWVRWVHDCCESAKRLCTEIVTAGVGAAEDSLRLDCPYFCDLISLRVERTGKAVACLPTSGITCLLKNVS